MKVHELVAHIKAASGWRVLLAHRAPRALDPFADERIPPVTLFIAKNLLTDRTPTSVQLRDVERQLNDHIRRFVQQSCRRVSNQEPKSRVCLLETVKDVVEVRVEDEGERGLASAVSLSRSAVFQFGNEGQLLKVEDSIRIGGLSAPNEALSISDRKISSLHLEISVVSSDTCMVRDLASRNGTRVNQRRIGHELVPVKPGDVIQIGETTIRFLRWSHEEGDFSSKNNARRRDQ